MIEQTTPLTMEIITSEQFKRANIKFSGIPSEEIRTALKNEGWVYSKNHNVWYPKNDAAPNSQVFAKYIKDTFFPEAKEEMSIITESSEKKELISLLETGASINEILSKITDIYGEESVHEALTTITNPPKSNIESISVNNTSKQPPNNETDTLIHSSDSNLYSDEVNLAKGKFSDIIRDTFLKVTDEEKDKISVEGKYERYNKWYKPMVDEIMNEIINENKDVMQLISDFNLDKESHVPENKWYSAEEAYARDVQYKLLPSLYEKIQERIKTEYEEQKLPYVMLFSSESPIFPSENKIYSVKEFNEILMQADKEFHNRKKYAEEKYGSADHYWDLEREDKLPDEDKGIQFGYDKTNFKFFNIPNPENPEDTFSYEPSRYDIGDGNGSIFDYVRSTCSHDEFINALNELETKLYFSDITPSQKADISNLIIQESKLLKTNLEQKMNDLDKAQDEYKELHKKWLIEASEAERVDDLLKASLKEIKSTYDDSINAFFEKALEKYPLETSSLPDSSFMKYLANEAKKMTISELYLPSRNAQKAMNEEDYKSYNSIDWSKLRKIWEEFPSNVNMDEYIQNLLSEKVKQIEVSKSDIVLPKKNESEPITEEDLEICRKLIPPSQYSFTLELTQGEEGDFFIEKLKEIANTYRKINTDEELINDDNTHNIGFRYFLGNTEIFITQIYKDGYAFGYSILNGDYQFSEWGDQNIEEITNIPWMEMDYHLPKNKTVEQMLHDEHPDYYPEVKKEETHSEEKPYNFFITDTAYLDLGIGAEFDSILNLSAEKAVLKYAELINQGYSPYIGLNIPGDFIFDDKEGRGAGIFFNMDGKHSFFPGDTFITELKQNDLHARNTIAAYKELYEMADKYILGVDKPNFVYEKEQILTSTYTPPSLYTFSPFGYEGNLIEIETELKEGNTAFDVIGLSDVATKETKARIQSAIRNSGLDFPSKRVLVSLTPADISKDGPVDLGLALSILSKENIYPQTEPMLVLGELELSGEIKAVRGAMAAVTSAKDAGITNVICDNSTAKLLEKINGINILEADNLKEAHEKLLNNEPFKKITSIPNETNDVLFNEEWLSENKNSLENLDLKGHFDTVRAIEIAIAGKHNILATGAPGCGKTLLTQSLFPALTPLLTEEEAKEPKRIASLAGLDSYYKDKNVPSFRIPHQTATIEGICGGGPNCRPGEITLAHKGTLFMDEAAEFRSSVIQMLRVPLETKQITLSRAGRTTVYPADFQLAMTMNPCPCGCYGSHDKICLDSAKSIEQYWKKISYPLLDRIEIQTFVEKDEKNEKSMSIDEMKKQISNAYLIQRKRGVFNSDMTPSQIQEFCKLNKSCQKYFDSLSEKGLSPRACQNLLKVSLTIANMDGRENIRLNDMKEANELCSPLFEKPKAFSYTPDKKEIDSDEIEVSENVHLYSAKYQKQRDENDKNREQLKYYNELHSKWVNDYEYENKDIPSWLNDLVSEDRMLALDLANQEQDFNNDISKKENALLHYSIAESLKPYDDIHLTVDNVIAAQKERTRIIQPILNGEKSGMWKAFEEFDEHGVFDIRGKELSMTKDKKISENGFKQLQAAMNIYRNKKFETFRYVLIDRITGEIKDQLAISSHMPNTCSVSDKSEDTVKQVISRAEEKDCLVVAVHNHPSGNTEASKYDKETTQALRSSLTRSDGFERLAGHIILDHDSFNLYTPKKGWHTVDALKKELDILEKKNNPEWSKVSIDDSTALSNLAVKLNDTYSWNDSFIPVVFTNSNNKISGVQYYSKNYFSLSPEIIRNEMQFEAMGVGAVSAFPVLTESLMEKLSGADRIILEDNMRKLVLHNAFTDCALKDKTVTEKFGIEAGRNFYDAFLGSKDRINEVHSTWKTRINENLFPIKEKSKKEEIER